MFKSIITNWKTSLAGLGILLATLGTAIGQYTSGGFSAVDVKLLLAGLAAATAAFAAKDADVSNAPNPIIATKVSSTL
jgi:hypothetical protein